MCLRGDTSPPCKHAPEHEQKDTDDSHKSADSDSGNCPRTDSPGRATWRWCARRLRWQCLLCTGRCRVRSRGGWYVIFGSLLQVFQRYIDLSGKTNSPRAASGLKVLWVWLISPRILRVSQLTSEILSLAQDGTSTPEGNGTGNLVRRAKVSAHNGKQVTSKTDSPIGSTWVQLDVHWANEMKERFWHPPQACTREYVTLLHVQGSASDRSGPI